MSADEVALSAAKQKKQLTVVGVLVVILVGAVLFQPSDDAPASAPAATMISLKTQPPETAPAEGESQPDRFQVVELSRLDQERIANTDLFRNFQVAAPVATEKPVTRAQRKHGISVGAVYGDHASNRPAAALVGETIIRSGDQLQGGRKVLDVSLEGIRVTN